MRQQRIRHGERGVDPVPRRSSVSAVKMKNILLIQNQLVEHAEICRRGQPLRTPKRIQIVDLPNAVQPVLQLSRCRRKARLIRAHRVIPKHPFEHPAAVEYLAENHVSGNHAALSGIIRNAILFFAKQHVPPRLPADPREKAPVRRQKAQVNVARSARTHQRRTRPFIGK